MSNLLKDIYSPAFYSRFSDVIARVLPEFDKEEFNRLIFDHEWDQRELKSRMKHTARVLHQFLPEPFEAAALSITALIEELQRDQFTESSLEFMFFPDYIESFGIDHFDAAVDAIETVTQFTSCEFAVRPFIIRYGDKMIRQMLKWSLHENHRVRRLSSEGMRPRLPWSIALPELKKDPTPLLPLLENLKEDPSEWVRRSVANNLNDISKDHPDVVIEIARRWRGIGTNTDHIVKHGCRSLLKQAHPEILEHYGLGNHHLLNVSDLTIQTPTVKIGDDLTFGFNIENKHSQPVLVRLEYGIHYLRKNGMHSKKVFKISERELLPYQVINIQRKQSFKLITTRTFYPGPQQLSLIVNGKEVDTGRFDLSE